MIWWIAAAAAFVVGGTIGILVQRAVFARKSREALEKASKIMAEAEAKARQVLLEAKEEAVKIKSEAETETRRLRSELSRQERKLSQRLESLERRSEHLERREQNLRAREKEIEEELSRVEKLKQEARQQLEVIAGMSSAEAREYLLQMVENEVRDDLAKRMLQVEAELKAEADERAREIIANAIQRCASEVSTETTVSVVHLPSDEMKGRLIGREGRNIRALESATGVDLIVDDTPEAVALSCFDPFRREIARRALEKLILDGRIHPARIEEMVEKARKEVETDVREEGEKVALSLGVVGLHPELLKLLGRLKYRTSFGQNMLSHSLEVAHLAAALAAEIGADVEIAKTAGLLHDIGKAVDQEVEGPHAVVGADLIKRLGGNPEVARAVAEHHGETEHIGLYGFIVSAADAISSSRPGARQESVEQYLKRIETLENIANSFPGVEKSYAIQAGREVRILVKPHEVDDLGALRLARDIRKKIEETLEYPGQIKVTVIRETRAVDYAK